MKYAPEFEIIADFLFVGYLLWASLQDIRQMQVARYTHVVGVIAVCMRIVCRCGNVNLEAQGFYESVDTLVESILRPKGMPAYWVEWLLSMCLHAGLQYMSQLCRLYGLADAIVFFLCGMYWSIGYGMYSSLMGSMLLQSIAGILLFVVQIAKKNLKRMHFKAPVPYIPYIFVAFFLTNGVL